MKHQGIAAQGLLSKVVRQPVGGLGIEVVREGQKTCPLRRERIWGWSRGRRYGLAVLGAKWSRARPGNHRGRLWCVGTAWVQPRLLRISKMVNVIAATGMGEGRRKKQHGGESKRHLNREPNHSCVVRPCHRTNQTSTGCPSTQLSCYPGAGPMQAKNANTSRHAKHEAKDSPAVFLAPKSADMPCFSAL